MRFEVALVHMREGSSVRRETWAENNELFIREGTIHWSYRGSPGTGTWYPTNREIMAEDWRLCDDPSETK